MDHRIHSFLTAWQLPGTLAAITVKERAKGLIMSLQRWKS